HPGGRGEVDRVSGRAGYERVAPGIAGGADSGVAPEAPQPGRWHLAQRRLDDVVPGEGVVAHVGALHRGVVLQVRAAKRVVDSVAAPDRAGGVGDPSERDEDCDRRHRVRVGQVGTNPSAHELTPFPSLSGYVTRTILSPLGRRRKGGISPRGDTRFPWSVLHKPLAK